LQRHIKSYHKDLRWKLDKEEKEKKDKIRAEMDKIQEEARICPFCQLKFNNMSVVQKHIIRMHPEEEEEAAEYEPDYPENSSSSLSILPSPSEISLSGLSEEPQEDVEQEVKIRKGSYKHACYICGATFVAKSRLKAHVEAYIAAPKVCLNCGRIFEKQQRLTKHLSVKACFRDYKCLVCGKQLLNHDNMMKHIRRQHPEHDEEAPKFENWRAEEDAATGSSDEEILWPDNLDAPLYGLREPIHRPDQRNPAEIAEDIEHERRYASVGRLIRQFDHGLLPIVNDGRYTEQGRNEWGDPQPRRLRRIEPRPQVLRDEESVRPVFAERERVAAGFEQPTNEIDEIFDEIEQGDDWRNYLYDDEDEIPDMEPFADAGNEQAIIIVGRLSGVGQEMDGRAREQLLTNGILASRQLLPRVIRFLNSVNIDTTSMRALHVMHIGKGSRPVPLQIAVALANPDIRTFVRLMAAIRAADALNQHPPKQIIIVLRGCSGFSVAGQGWTRWWHMHEKLNIRLIVCNDLHPLNNVYAASAHLVHFEGTKAFGIYDLNRLMRQHARIEATRTGLIQLPRVDPMYDELLDWWEDQYAARNGFVPIPAALAIFAREAWRNRP